MGIAEKLPISKTDHVEIKARAKLWKQFDYNGNGLLSVNEAHTGLRSILSEDELK